MDVDVVVVGGGVLGLACAARIAGSGRSLVLLERHGSIVQETSSRNSGVIHAGIYYPPGSLKARACVRGRALLYERCSRLDLAHRRVGKLIVATSEPQIATLQWLLARGRDNGAGALVLLDAREVREREPHVRAVAALWSPESGIVDAHELASSYKAEATAAGAQLCFHTRVTGLRRERGAWRVHTEDAGGEGFSLSAGAVVNAAGLAAHEVCALAGLDIDRLGYRQHFCKGDYFSLASELRGLTRHLIYPVPVKAGLGIHITCDLSGRLIAGPDTTYVPHPRYDVSPDKAEAFAEALSRFVPSIRAEHLSPDYAGIRPKLQGPGEGFRDFLIEEASAHGAPRLINLLGIESPGLTASAALAERVADILDRA